ncbi:MAG: hypothetical protein ACKOUS_09375 [Alphaproteobacteria bacterium]
MAGPATILRACAGAALALALGGCALDLGGPAAGEGPQATRGGAAPAGSPPPERDVERLVGVSRERLLAALGPSSFTRRDGPAEIWRYATDDCFLTFFLPRGDPPRGAALTVHHVEANARTRAASAWVNPRNCYGQVLQQRGLPQATS